MARNYSNWIDAFVDYASYCEAPSHIYFWVGISVIAGALRRRVWIDQKYFSWFPNFYIILVAPPEVISKSTSIGVGMDLLKELDGINFGPNIVSWQALVDQFEKVEEQFEWPQGTVNNMNAMTITSSELGNFLNTQDMAMVDALITLWDCSPIEKTTKHSGSNRVENPWLNLIACTTPAWLTANIPDTLLGGGFLSRCLFVFADKKRKRIAYPALHTPDNLEETAAKLVQDLVEISHMKGEFIFTSDAIAYGEEWYGSLEETSPGYIKRKQTHVHKVAMVLAASEGNEPIITAEVLKRAVELVERLEADMPLIIHSIGKTKEAVKADDLITFICKRDRVSLEEAFQYSKNYFPRMTDFEDILRGAIRGGLIRQTEVGQTTYLMPVKKS